MADFPEYVCPVCNAQMEYERSWGCYGVDTTEEHECPTCKSILRVNCQNRDALADDELIAGKPDSFKQLSFAKAWCE